eukprot:5162293-Pleurochrysis_carterae.AAC.1
MSDADCGHARRQHVFDAHAQPRAGGCCRAHPKHARARAIDRIGRHSGECHRLLLCAPGARARAH